MKKFLMLLMTLLLVSGCQTKGPDLSKMTPEQQYEEAIKANKNMKSAEVEAVISFQMDYNGQPYGAEVMTAWYKIEYDKEVKMETKMNLEGTMMHAFIADGYMYVEMDGMKFKTAYAEEVNALDQAPISAEMMSVEQISNLKSVFEDDHYIISYDVKEEMLMEKIKEYLDGLSYLEVDYRFKDVKAQTGIDKEANPSYLLLEFTLEIVEGEEVIEATFKMEATITNVNKTKVVLPSDLSDYQEMNYN